jgi:hypothetical protein
VFFHTDKLGSVDNLDGRSAGTERFELRLQFYGAADEGDAVPAFSRRGHRTGHDFTRCAVASHGIYGDWELKAITPRLGGIGHGSPFESGG